MSFVNAMNAIHDNVWALAIIVAGGVLACFHQKELGGTLVTLGAAVFQRKAQESPKEEK